MTAGAALFGAGAAFVKLLFGKRQDCSESEGMAGAGGYRVRLRVRLTKPLNTEDASRTVIVAGRDVVVASQEKGQPLNKSQWIVLVARGFLTEDEAQRFGNQLRAIVELVGLCARIGADVGQDKPTGFVNEDWARSMGLVQPDERVAPNIHGLAVLPDDDKTRIPLINAEATVLADPAQFLGALMEIGPDLPDDFSIVEHGVRALNLAIASQEALSRMAIAISAVEALGQSETWTPAQKTLLNELATRAESSTDVSEPERQEVADALRRGVQRLGLRQGVMRVLDSLGLRHLREEWDRIYRYRSGIFHGTLKLRNDEIAQLALDAETLCARIVLAFAQSKGVPLASIADSNFPVA